MPNRNWQRQQESQHESQRELCAHTRTFTQQGWGQGHTPARTPLLRAPVTRGPRDPWLWGTESSQEPLHHEAPGSATSGWL